MEANTGTERIGGMKEDKATQTDISGDIVAAPNRIIVEHVHRHQHIHEEAFPYFLEPIPIRERGPLQRSECLYSYNSKDCLLHALTVTFPTPTHSQTYRKPWNTAE